MPETLLIVDDVPQNLAVLGELLRSAGYAVRAAKSGAMALEYAWREPIPDLALLDIMMPHMDGHQVLARLRADARTADMPVIFVTAMDSADAELHGLESGAADYITKPIKGPVVLARVRTQLELKRTRDWLRDQNAYLESEVARRFAELRRVQAESEQIQSRLNRQLELILGSTGEGICGLDLEGIISFVNPAGAAMLGATPEALLGRRFHSLVHDPQGDGNPDREDDCPLHAAVTTGAALRTHLDLFRRKDGSRLPVEWTCMPLREDERLLGTVLTWQDVGERQAYLEQLERKSNFDELTGLPNRNLLADRLARAIARSREDGSALALLTLDLDRFKQINDGLGRAAGDRVIQAIAERLSRLLAPTDTLARGEGDEFVLVIAADELEAVTGYVRPIQDALGRPLAIGGRELVVCASLGIAVFPRDGDCAEALMRNAAAAMLKAKREGGEGFRFYAPAMNASVLARLELEHGLRRAIQQNGLVLYYQPQIEARSGRIIGAEALVRWPHPEQGMLTPGHFIPLAEDAGLVAPLGEWVLREACRQNRAWQDAGLAPLVVAVNVSARQLAVTDLVAMTAKVLRETGLDPVYLELELTESAALGDIDAFVEASQRLRALSVSLALDDFGTGFSSLSYLRRFAIDRLKIDRSFVSDLPDDPGSAEIVAAIIGLAHSLHMVALAEGVETAEQVEFLAAQRCDEMQGYYFSRPVPADELAALLRAQPFGPPAASDGQ